MGKSSNYKGVSFNKKAQKWYSNIWVNKKVIHVGSFDSELDAYEARVAYLAENNIPEYKPSGLTVAELKTRWKTDNKDRVSIYNARYREANKIRLNHTDRQLKWNLRIALIEAYGGKCECCGELTPEFLTIDHVNGDGKEHRELTGGGGYKTYRWLKMNGFPKEGYRLLCFNCTCAIGHFGYCPHSRKK